MPIQQMAISARPGTRFVRKGVLYELLANDTLAQLLTVRVLESIAPPTSAPPELAYPHGEVKKLRYPPGTILHCTSRPFYHQQSGELQRQYPPS